MTPEDEPRRKGMVQRGRDGARITLANTDGTLLFEQMVGFGELFAPPTELAAEWADAEWDVVDVDEGEPTVRKVITVFVVTIGLDGRVQAHTDISARYDMSREATLPDMLIGVSAVRDDLMADLYASKVATRLGTPEEEL